MNREKLSIRFVISNAKKNKAGLCPISCRITFKKKRKPFSTGLFVNPDHWNSKYQRAHPPNKENDFINAQLSLVKQQINQAFLLLQYQGEPFTVDDIYRQFKGGPENNDKAVLEVFEEHNKRVEKQNFSQRRLQQVKDMFVFCCYTGLAYREMADFDEEKLSRTFNQWKSQSRKSKFHILS